MPCVVGQKSLIPEGNNNMNFWLAHDQVVLFETVENLWALWHKATKFFAFFLLLSWEVQMYNKTLNDWSHGKQWVLFPLDISVYWTLISGHKIHCFPWGKSLLNKCLVFTRGKGKKFWFNYYQEVPKVKILLYIITNSSKKFAKIKYFSTVIGWLTLFLISRVSVLITCDVVSAP